MAIAVANGKFGHFLRFGGTEVPDRVEHPDQGDAEIPLASRPSVFQTLENGVEVLLAKQAHADGNIDLGVQNVLSLQPLHQSIRDQFVVGGSCEVFRDVAKGNQEAREVRVLVELLYVSQRTREAVGLLDFEQGER